ncbi:MAG: tryptophan synthase subunit alpha [Pseudonocardiaceae bacterium]|nr:tryptophan synthase subunit alpha [Pseudonocardiaceae bacterium]
MSRITEAFAATAARDELALVAYLCAGYPNPAETVGLVTAAVEAGADVIELGVPFSDPLGDGPVIQECGRVALAAGTTLAKVLELVAELRAAGVDAPIALMGYVNPFLRYGFKRLADVGEQVGVDGLIVPDLPAHQALHAGARRGAARARRGRDRRQRAGQGDRRRGRRRGPAQGGHRDRLGVEGGHAVNTGSGATERAPSGLTSSAGSEVTSEGAAQEGRRRLSGGAERPIQRSAVLAGLTPVIIGYGRAGRDLHHASLRHLAGHPDVIAVDPRPPAAVTR